eukprot:403330801
MESSNQLPLNIIKIKIDQQLKKLELKCKKKNLKKLLKQKNQNENPQDLKQFQTCFTIGVIGKQQIGKSTLLRSLFQAPFKSSPPDQAGGKITDGIDMAVQTFTDIVEYHKQQDFQSLDQIENYDQDQLKNLQLCLLDAEGFRGSENITKFVKLIEAWNQDKRKQNKEARKLANLASVLESLLLLEVSNILLLIAKYDDDWQEFEDFIESFQIFSNQERSLPKIIFVIRDADNDFKKDLARNNFKNRILDRYENSQEIHDQIELMFLPKYTREDQYLKDNQHIVKRIADQIGQENLDYLPTKPYLMQQILSCIDRLNENQDALDYHPLSYLDKQLLLFQTIYNNNESLKELRNTYKQIQEILEKEAQIKEEIKNLDIPHKKQVLYDSRALSHTMSGISMGTSAAGVGTAAAAIAGAAVIPVVGWVIAGLALGGVASQIAVEQTVIKGQHEEVQREFEKMSKIMNQVRELDEILKKIKNIDELSPQMRDLQRFILYIIHSNEEELGYEDIKTHYSNLMEKIQKIRRDESDNRTLSTNLSDSEFNRCNSQGFESATNISKDLTKAAAQVSERIGNQILQTTLKVENLARNSRKVYKLVDTTMQSVESLSSTSAMGGFASRQVGTSAYRLIGENTKAVKNIKAFDAAKVQALSAGAKVAQGIGMVIGIAGLALESFAVWQTEDDFHRKLEYFDKYEEAMHELENELPNMFQYLREFIEFQPQDND